MKVDISIWFSFSAMDYFEPDQCAICTQPFNRTEKRPSSALGKKGCSRINQASIKRNDSITVVPGEKVHQDCRRKYCNPQQIAKATRQKESKAGTSSNKHVLRSSEGGFNFRTDCLFCGRPAKCGRKRKTRDVLQVKTVEFKETLIATCRGRADSWSNTVQARILSVHDLHAADAIYHQTCSVNFRTKKQMPAAKQDSTSQKRAKLGRPRDNQRTLAFLEVAAYLEENDDEQITINDLIGLMEEKLADTEYETYSYTYMKKRLQDHFGDKIIQTEINGTANVVTFRTTAKALLQDHYQQMKQDPNEEKIRLVKTAAKLIREDIKDVETTYEAYPSCEDLESVDAGIQFLPETLQVLLEGLFTGKRTGAKVASIGQAMMQATRPRVLLAPLQLGLGVQLHHHFASRFLIDSLHRHGFCCSYEEVHRFERNAAQSHGTDIPNLTAEFVQYAADNVDHNIRTLDGHGTFHGMGMIATITPGTSSVRRVPRAKTTSLDIAMVGRVQIQYHKEESRGMTAVVYKKLGLIVFIEILIFFAVILTGYFYMIKRGAFKWQ